MPVEVSTYAQALRQGPRLVLVLLGVTRRDGVVAGYGSDRNMICVTGCDEGGGVGKNSNGGTGVLRLLPRPTLVGSTWPFEFRGRGTSELSVVRDVLWGLITKSIKLTVEG